MSGWPAVALIVTGQIAVAAFLIRLGARRWWDYLAIAVLTAMLVRPTARYLTGDVSRYLPDATWSGADDKEQIIYASAASTILLPLIASALVFYLFTQAWRALRPQPRS
jgi:hypothetical protein